MNAEDSSIDARIAQVMENRAIRVCEQKITASTRYKRAGRPEFAVLLRGTGATAPVASYELAGDGCFTLKGEALVHFKDQAMEDTLVKYAVSGQVGVILAMALTPGINAALSHS